MKIDFEELKLKKNISFCEKIDFSKREITDALLKQINISKINCNVTLIDNDEALVKVDCNFNAKCLDARNLELLNVNFNFQEEVFFTNNLQKAQELDIDFTKDSIELEELIWELMLVSIPYNYSKEAKSTTFIEEELNSEQKPFANLFKNNYEEV